MFKPQPYLQLLRPRQWLKNLFIAAPLLFSSKLLDLMAICQCTCAIILFCQLASLIYIFNDWRDREIDRHHLKNRFRPFAAATLNARQALIFSLGWGLLFLGMIILTLRAEILAPSFFAILALYVLINLAYSLGLKNIPLVEMFLVASGYVLRVLAGCLAIEVKPSPWIIVVSAVVSLLLVAGKRRAEITEGDAKERPRKVVAAYNVSFLDSLISIFASATIITYMLFTLSEQTILKHHTENLIYSSVFVVFGVSRYLLLLKVRGGAEAPTDLVISDSGIRWSVILWVASLIFIMYGPSL